MSWRGLNWTSPIRFARAGVTTPNRFLVIQKWDNPAVQQAHFDSPAMVEMAQACTGILSQPPTIDLYEGLSAHDLA